MPHAESTPVTDEQYGEYIRLRDLLQTIKLRTGLRAPDTQVDGFEADYARRFMADTARFVGREPGGRALLRLPATGAIGKAQLMAAIGDADVALLAFQANHADPDDPDDLYLD